MKRLFSGNVLPSAVTKEIEYVHEQWTQASASVKYYLRPVAASEWMKAESIHMLLQNFPQSS